MKKFVSFFLTILIFCLGIFLFLDKVSENDTIEENLNLEAEDMDFEELNITIITEGSGDESKNGDTLVVNYIGTLKDGTQFDSSYDRGESFEFTLGAGSVIQGWEEGMLGMKTGEKRKIEIPSSIGYGENAVGSVIPANAGLIFEVELLEIK